TVNVSGANYSVVMANNSTLSGLTINNTNNNGGQNAQAVLVNGVTGVTITNNTINATMNNTGTAHGVDVIGGRRALISGNTINGLGPNGASLVMAVQVNGAGSTATISNNVLSASGGTGTNAVTDLTIATINAGSTGNVRSAGTCVTAGVITGTVFFTN